MDWLLATPQIHSTFSSLGSMEGETYVVSPNALVILEEINYKLIYEDQTLRTFRRAIGFSQNVRSDLIPLLKSATNYDVLDSVIRILVNLTVPVECLFSVDVMYRTEVGRHTIFELNKLLYTSKEAFTDPKSTKPVVEFMKHILESDSKLSLEKCNQINNCLLLLRNILHIPETNVNFILPTQNVQSGNALPASMQNAILWNLFIQSIDKLLIYLMTCPQRSFWGVTMVQLIALLYKDQHTNTMTKMLNMWFEASLSESSDDNESNTTPSKQGSGDSSPMLTSDPTSDSSDNGSGGKNESSEDRRQALREETKATLQEVSRKGHEYQNSILRVLAQRRESSGEIVPQEESILESIMEQGETPTNEKHEALFEQQQEQPANRYNNTSNGQGEETCFKSPAAPETNEANSFAMPPPALPATKTNPDHFNAMGNNNNNNNNNNNSNNNNGSNNNSSNNNNNTPPKPTQKVRHCTQLQLTKGKCLPQKRECPSSNSELSDCGYGTQVENQESISTSSNDDDGTQGKPQHQKPPCNSKSRNKPRAIITLVTKKELRRKKLVKRSKSSLINMKGLVQHTPTDEDISNLLKEFTVDFLLKGYGCLVGDLHNQLVTNVKIVIDTSHYFWLVTYFLKFAAQLELDLEHMNSILTFDVISYLVYEGVTLCEQLDLNATQEGSDVKPYLRRLHLVVTAIREFLQAIETFKKVTHLSEEDRECLQRLQVKISSSEDLRNLFVLLLRRFDPSLHTKQYLQDLIVTNHILLVLLDSVTKSETSIHIKMIDHVSQFATLEVMHHYGTLLEDFNNNGEFVNDCIFTMMHHIGGDLGQINTLFQPVILKTYSRIWEADYELCDDWSDLIEYVIHKFMNTPRKSSLSLPPISLTALTKEYNLENTVFTWTQEEMDTLYWYYVQSKKTDDVVGKIVKLFSNNGNKQKSRISIIQQLLQQDIITLVEYDDLMKFEDAEYQRALLPTSSETTSESGIELKDSTTYDKPSDDIQILLDLIIKEKSDKHLIWLQKLLLECCYIKLTLKKNTLRQDNENLQYIMEPMAYHCILKKKSIPIVQWNSDQASTMMYQPFVLLLHKLGFQLPADAGSIFARIPDFWTADTMYSLAKKLGPMDKLLIKFDENLLKDVTDPSTDWRHSDAPRASLSSVSSLEIDIPAETEVELPMEKLIPVYTRSGLLSPVSEVDVGLENEIMAPAAPNEMFSIPKVKHCNSFIRFTPDPAPPPSVPNWLQLVMQSKFNTTTTTATSTATSTSTSETNRNDLRLTLTNMSALMTITSGATSYIMNTTTAPSSSASATSAAPTAAAQAPAPAATTTKCLALNLTVDNKSSSNTTSAATTPTTPVHKHNAVNIKNGNSNNNTNNNNCNSNNNNNNTNNSYNNNSNDSNTNMSNVTITLNEQQTNLQAFNTSDDDSAMKSLDSRMDEGEQNYSSNSSGFFTRRESSTILECKYSAMVASVYENEFADFDHLSVTCDLTRMYVSDEDEKPDIASLN